MSSDALAPVRPEDGEAYARATRAQGEAADPDGSAWVAANAGSGKTKVLIDRVARLLLRRAAPDSILCITYTRAAANEMVSRLFKRLGDWSVMGEAKLAGELAALEGRAAKSYSAEELRAARALFAKALETPGGLRIETIHAFCGRILRRFPLEAGIPPGFREIEEAEAERLWREAVRGTVTALAREAPDLLDLLALEGGGHGVSAAVGLVRAQAARLSRFIAGHSGEAQAMAAAIRAALKAPEASAAEVCEAAVVTHLPLEEYRAAIETLRTGAKTDIATAERLEAALGENAPEARWTQLTGLWRTAAGGLRKSNPYTAAVAKTAPFIADLFQVKEGEGREITRLKQAEQDLNAAEAAGRTLALLGLAAPLLARYRDLKRRRGALDFDDLIEAARGLLTRPGLSLWVLYKLDRGIDHVLLDEAQDTSPDQWELIEALTAEFFAGEGAERAQDPRTLFVVGDQKQSIYSFQGARPALFLQGRREFTLKTQNARTPDMAMSFRSSPEVLGFVDAVFDSDAFEGPAFSPHPPSEADAPRHEARREGQPGRVTLWPLEEPPESEDADPWDAPLDALPETSPKARLARRVAEELAAMIERGETVWREMSDGAWQRAPLQPGDVLILVRGRTGGLFDSLITALKRAGLPVAGADRLVLSEHIGVQDCLNLMRFALMPQDDLTLAEILRGPFCDLVDDDNHLFPLAHERGKRSLWARLQASTDAAFAEATVFLAGLIDRRHFPPFEFLSAVLDRPGIAGETGWERIGARLGTPARDPIEALLARAIGHDRDQGASLQTFLAAMARDASEIKRDLAAPGRAVRVMTVHGAKGLEAPLVILPDSTAMPQTGRPGLMTLNGEVPVWSPRKAGETDALAAAREEAIAEDLREHRRLLYVALTRAADRLIVCGPWYGRSRSGRDDQSWYALAEAGMDRLGVPTDEGGARHYGPPPVIASADAAGPRGSESVPDWLWQPAEGEMRSLRALSPSALAPERARVFSPLDGLSPSRIRRGRLIHSLLERLPALPEADQAAEAETWLARQPDLDAGERAEIVSTVLATLSEPAFAEIFGHGARAEAAIIGAGKGWPEGMVINGRVDRLVIRPGRVLVVDIKTDRPPPDDPADVDPAYLAQMAAYQNVLEAAWPDRPVECALLWTDGPKLMPLDRDALLAALKRAQSGV